MRRQVGDEVNLRFRNLTRLRNESFDVLIVGGGINGAAAAAALSAHGARVALIDRGDFAQETSQQSSNLAWGGIKYLETGELGLVRKLCNSRNRLLTAYPSSIREIRFLVTMTNNFRHHRATVYLGAWLYWLLGGGFTRMPRLLRLADIASSEPAVDTRNALGGFEFSDAHLVETDARFVFGFVRRALNTNAAVANYVESRGSVRDREGFWQTCARDETSGTTFTIRSRSLINACGPAVEALNLINSVDTRHRHVFSKGVHLIVNRITDSNRVLSFFADDGRLFFVIPLDSKSCIGTTDTRVSGLPAVVTADDRRFILDNINKRLRLERPLCETDIIAERCGVRPLAVSSSQASSDVADWTALSRRHAIDVDFEARHISIFGGKITDCLNVGDEITSIAKRLGIVNPERDIRWYGEPPEKAKATFMKEARELLGSALASSDEAEGVGERLWRRYELEAHELLREIRQNRRAADTVIAGTPYLRCELLHIAQREMVSKLDDFLRRRSTIALTTRRSVLSRLPGLLEACEILFGDEARNKIAEYFGEHEHCVDAHPQRFSLGVPQIEFDQRS